MTLWQEVRNNNIAIARRVMNLYNHFLLGRFSSVDRKVCKNVFCTTESYIRIVSRNCVVWADKVFFV